MKELAQFWVVCHQLNARCHQLNPAPHFHALYHSYHETSFLKSCPTTIRVLRPAPFNHTLLPLVLFAIDTMRSLVCIILNRVFMESYGPFAVVRN